MQNTSVFRFISFQIIFFWIVEEEHLVVKLHLLPVDHSVEYRTTPVHSGCVDLFVIDNCNLHLDVFSFINDRITDEHNDYY